MFEWFSWHSFTSNVISFRAIIASTTAAPDARGGHEDGRQAGGQAGGKAGRAKVLDIPIGHFLEMSVAGWVSNWKCCVKTHCIHAFYLIFPKVWKKHEICVLGEMWRQILCFPPLRQLARSPNKTCRTARNSTTAELGKVWPVGKNSNCLRKNWLRKKPLCKTATGSELKTETG